MDEFAFIKWIRNQQKKDKNITIGIGDDCSSIKVNDNKVYLVTTDMLIEGTHFELKKNTPKEIGRKSIACSVSDIAAMGCFPKYAVISICFHYNVKTKFAKELFMGMKKEADEYNIKIVGGDIVSGKKILAINVAIFGENDGLIPLTRSGARAGDIIMVTGTLGGSILRKHIAFKPRLREGLILNKKFHINSMIDVSDGLIADLNHILEESRVGAILYEDKIPISPDARRLARKTGLSTLHHALHDGEDYELLFTLPNKESDKLVESRAFPIRVSKIGHIKKSIGLFIQNSNGKRKKIKPKGYEHFKENKSLYYGKSNPY
ncbi:MAG: thiamine-monophosphate kinase [Candidatus Scalinduaceae bacterium]